MAVERFPIEAGHVLLFARSVGIAEETYAGLDLGVTVPPTFVQCSAQFDPTWPFRPSADRPWVGSGDGPTRSHADGDTPASKGRTGGGLHAEQRFTYHRPVQTGDVLSSTVSMGDRWEKVGRRGGRLVFSESITKYRNQHGDLVITAVAVGVEPERVPEAGS